MKTEKEKMLAGEPYDCGDTELINRWHKAKQLQKEYNDTPSDDIEKLSSLLDDLIGSRGENVWISAPFFVDYGERFPKTAVFAQTFLRCGVVEDCIDMYTRTYSRIIADSDGITIQKYAVHIYFHISPDMYILTVVYEEGS